MRHLRLFYLTAWLIILGFFGWSGNLLLNIQEKWSTETELHQFKNQLGTLIRRWHDLNRPGNDVLENYEVKRHQQAFEYYLQQYQEARSALESASAYDEAVVSTISRFDAQKRLMTERALRTLELAQYRERLRLHNASENDIRATETEAASTMARMDQAFQKGLDLILRVDESINLRVRQLEYLQKRNFQFLYLMLLIALVTSALSIELVRRSIRQREALRERSARIKAIVNNVVDGIVTVDDQGAIETFNPAAEQIFGVGCKEMLGKKFTDLLSQDCGLENCAGCPRQANNCCYIEGLRPDQSHFPIELAVSQMQFGDRRLSIHIVRDITERRRAEEELRQAASVFDNTTESILITDRKGVIQSVNPAYTQITGYQPEEVTGARPPLHYTPKQDHRYYRKIYKTLLQTGLWQGELWTKRKSGEVVPLWLTINTIKDHQGNPSNYIIVAWDISELKTSERMKDEFISTVSHELRTPLTSIRGALGLILGGVAGEIPEQACKLIQIADTNSQRLVRLINDILDLEKMQVGKLRFSLQPLDLGALVEQAIRTNQAYGAQFGIEFELRPATGNAMVIGDSDRLMQVLTNLLSNAAKFSPPGDRVIVSVTNQQQKVRIAVTDHGPGIPESFRPQVFKKFAQADASDSRQKGGTGLGLSICKLIVENLGGSIGFDSEADVQTTFYVDLPEMSSRTPAPPPSSLRHQASVLPRSGLCNRVSSKHAIEREI